MIRKEKTLTVWFDDPEKEYVSEETGDGFSLQGLLCGYLQR
jgi:hypothetical protein